MPVPPSKHSLVPDAGSTADDPVVEKLREALAETDLEGPDDAPKEPEWDRADPGPERPRRSVSARPAPADRSELADAVRALSRRVDALAAQVDGLAEEVSRRVVDDVAGELSAVRKELTSQLDRLDERRSRPLFGRR